MENLTINQGIKFTAGDGTGVIGTADPSGSQGIAKTAGHTGFYITSDVDYTLWFYDGSSWSAHQSIDVSDANYSEGFSFAWGSNTAAYIKTADSSHEVYVFGRDTDLKVDSTPNDGNQSFDQVVDGTGSLSITSIDAQNDYTSGISITDGTVSFNRTDQNAAYSLTFSGNGITVGNDGSNTITLTGADEFTTPLTTDGDLFVQAGGSDARLGIGSDGQYLSVSSGAPVWADVTSVSLGTNKQVPYMNAGGTDFSYSSRLTFDDSTNPYLKIIGNGTEQNILRLDDDLNPSTTYMRLSNFGNLTANYIGNSYDILNQANGLFIRTTDSRSMYLRVNSSVDNLGLHSNGNITIGDYSQNTAARLYVKGEGNTSATSAFVVKNSSNTTLFEVKDDGTVQANGSDLPALSNGSLFEINTGAANTLASNYTQGFLVVGDNHTLSGGGRRSIVSGYGNYAGSNYVNGANMIGVQNYYFGGQFSTAIGSGNRLNAGNYSFAAGYINQIWGDNAIALGHGTHVGSASADADNSIAIGYYAKAVVTNQMVFGKSVTTHATYSAKEGIYFGWDSGRPTAGMIKGDTNQAFNFLMGGTNAVRTDLGTIVTGMGEGIFYLNNYSDSNIIQPTANATDSVGMWAKSRAAGVTGLIIKAENGNKSWIGDRIGINISTATGTNSTLGSSIDASLHIYGEGNSSSTSSLKVENSDNSVAIEVLDDLVVVMPNLPTSSAGLPTGALYNDGGTVKVA